MSALNICMKDDKVVLMYDSAAYDEAGVIVDFVQKGYEIPQMRAFVACTGSAAAALVLSRVLPDVYADIDDVAEGGEALMHAVYEKIAGHLENFARHGLTAAIVGYSKKLGRPKIIMFSRGAHGDGFADDVGYITHPQLEGRAREAWIASQGCYFNIDRFDPETDGIRLLEMQRSMLHPRQEGAKAHLIGGYVTIAEVSERGATTRVVHRWEDDKVGERIRPSSPDADGERIVALKQPPTGLNRQQRRAWERKNRRVA